MDFASTTKQSVLHSFESISNYCSHYEALTHSLSFFSYTFMESKSSNDGIDSFSNRHM